MVFIPVLWKRALDDNSNNGNQTIFQHMYFIVAVAIALLLVAWRLSVLRKTNRPATDFLAFGQRSASQRPQEHGYNPSYQPPGVPLAPINAVYRPDQRPIHAADTDADGRRLGRPDDPGWDGKDVLPAYDRVGGPPKYIASEQYALGSQTQYQPQLADGAPVVMPTPHILDSENGAMSQQSVGVRGASAQGEGVQGDDPRLATSSPGVLTPPPAYHAPRS